MPARPLALAAALAVAAGTALAVAPAAQAAATYPSGARITGVTSTSVTVTVNKIADKDVTGYILAASTDKSQVTTSKLNAASNAKYRSTGRSRTNTITTSGMKYTTSPYYYRVGATYGRYKNYVAWAQSYSSAFGLRPATPSGLRTSDAPGAGRYLTWKAGASTGAQIEQTDTSTGRRTTYTIHNTTPIFTPFGLTPGHTYSYRVRALNQATASGESGAVTLTAPSHTTSLRMMSYNVLGAVYTEDGTEGADSGQPGWRRRIVGAAKLVEQVRPDVLDVQEGDTILGSADADHPGNHAYLNQTWTVPANSCNAAATHSTPAFRGDKFYLHYWPYRQVDSLCDRVNSDLHSTIYARAVDGTPNHNGSTNYVVYNTRTMSQLTAAQLGVSPSACWMSDDPSDTAPSTATAAGTKCGGYFSLESSSPVQTERAAAWAALRINSSGVRVLVVSPHTSAEAGAAFTKRRIQQVTNLISRSRAIAARLHITRIIYAGDFNTYVGRKGDPDVTTPIMKNAGYPDSIENAQRSYNTQYLSGNQYRRSPLEEPNHQPGYQCIDHIYVTPGIAVRTFGEAMRLNSRGEFSDAAIPSDHNPVYADLTLQY